MLNMLNMSDNRSFKISEKDSDLVVENEDVSLEKKVSNATINIKTSFHDLSSKNGSNSYKEIVSKATYRKKGNLAQIVYIDSELGGMFENFETKIVIHNDCVTIYREDGHVIASTLMIQNQKKLFSDYWTPFGNINLGIKGNALESDLDESGGTLHMNYVLDMNGSAMSENDITITVKLNSAIDPSSTFPLK